MTTTRRRPATTRLVGGLLLVAALTGCGSFYRDWSYAPEPRSATDPIANVRVVIVLPFEDRRLNENRHFTGLALIPLMPFGWLTLDRPERHFQYRDIRPWRWRLNGDLAEAVAQEVENARIFRETFVGNKASDADYVLLGEIVSTKFELKAFSYGLSAGGMVLWFFGFPARTTSNELILTLRLGKTQSAPAIWTHTIREKTSTVSWVYVMRPEFTYDQLLKQGLRDAITSLAATARTLK